MTDLAARSLQVIRDGQAASGAFIAGPTFSQYGYAWLRDGAFIAEALDLVGERSMAARFHDWVADVVLAGRGGIERSMEAASDGRVPARADHLHCRYRADGTTEADDWPTFQLDGPGIWLWSIAHHADCGGSLTERHRDAAGLVASYLAALWPLPCADAWEESPEHVHTSTLGAISAGLRAWSAIGAGGSPELASDGLIGAASSAIETRLFGGGGAWSKWTGTDAVDASLLWLVAPYAVVRPDHPRFTATLARIEADLVSPDGGVHRYHDDTYYGGGEWLLLTAALGRTYLRRGAPGDRHRAERALRWIERQASGDGLLPEQVATHALHPGEVEGWQRRWGPSACPLLWSHASYLALRAELAMGVGGA
jgi:GH15 family glucan-1,4-alpha-glucosidase